MSTNFTQKVLDRYKKKAQFTQEVLTKYNETPAQPTSLRDLTPKVFASQKPAPGWQSMVGPQPIMKTAPEKGLLDKASDILQEQRPNLYGKVQRGKEIAFNIDKSLRNVQEIRKAFSVDTIDAPSLHLNDSRVAEYLKPRLNALVLIAHRAPEVFVQIPTNAVNFFRKNIATIRAGEHVETKQFQTILGMKPEQIGLDSNEMLKDTIEAGMDQYSKELVAHPDRSDHVNALMASAKTVVPDVLDVLLAAQMTDRAIQLTGKGLQASAKKLPDSVLFKMQQKQVQPQALLDALIHGKPTGASAKDFNIAKQFINNLTTQERKAIFSLARSYETMGLQVTLPEQATPTLLGKIAGRTPKTTLPPTISGLLPGKAVSGQSGFINPEAISKDLTAIAQKATSLASFEKALTKPQLAILTARGLTSQSFFDAVKTPDLTQEALKYKSAEEFVGSSINNLNPTSGVFVQHSPDIRAKAPLGENMTTLDKTAGGNPSDVITVYRGTPGKEILPGDFVTTNKQLAQDYAGTGRVVEARVKKGDILDDITEPLGEEYIYRPDTFQEKTLTKSELTDIWNKAQGAVSTTDIPRVDPNIPIAVNKVPINDIPRIQQNPPEYVAMRTMRDGSTRPAIRKTGIFAPKEFETHLGKDISGLLGGQSWNLRDALISWDNVSRTQLAKTGDVGPGEKLQYQGKETDASIMNFGNQKAQAVRDIAKQYNLDLNNKTTDIQVTLALHGLKNADIIAKGPKQAIIDTLRSVQISEEAIKQALQPGFLQSVRGKESIVVESVKNGIPVQVTNAVERGLRPHLESLRTDVNAVRTSLGKTPIKQRENYGPVLQQTSFYSQMRTKPKTEITDNFDYIIPNAKKNPHALSRNAGAADLEWRASNLLTRYHESIARDMYDAPFIEQLKAVNSVLKPKYPRTSKLIERHIREQRVGKPAMFDSLLGITEGTRKRAILNKVNTARNIQALALNLVWIGFVQPASLALTVAKAGPINLTKGIIKFATSPQERAYIKTLPTMQTKSKGLSVGSTGAGDLDKLGNRIVKGKIETLNDFVGKLADANEYWLTGASMLAGKEKALQLGLKGNAVDMYADWMGGSTQSEYNKTARPMITNNILVRTNWPFSTFQFELYRYGKTLAGLPGGRPLGWQERFNQIILLLGGMYVYDAYLDKTIGRRLSTEKIDVGDIPNIPIVTSDDQLVVPRIASWFPIAADTIDDLMNKAYRTAGIEEKDRAFASGSRAAGALHRDIQTLMSAVDGFVRHGNIQPMRKELIKWGMGFTGTPGAATVNRLVDGLIATSQGFQTDRTDRKLFRIEGIDRYLAPLLGPYSTRAGIDFMKEGNSIIEQDAIKEKKRLEALPSNEAKIEFDKITARNPNLARMINQLIEDDKNPILAEIRGLPNDMKAEKLVDLFEDIPVSERQAEYQKLIDAGEVTTDVTQKYMDLIEKQEQAAMGEIPDFADGQERSDKSILKTVGLYAKAIGSDPIDAFTKMFAGETIRRVDNGAIIVERMDFKESEAVRKERAKASELKSLRLDHLIPLQLGGTNADRNLILVSIEEHAAYTPIENLLGDQLRAGKIKRKEAQTLIRDFKEGKISAEEIFEKYPPTGEGMIEKFNQDWLDLMNYDESLRNIIQ